MKWILFALLSVAFVFGIAVLWNTAAGHQGEVQKTVAANKVPEVTLDAAAAQASFTANCMSCHGADLQGGVGPNLQKVGSKLTVDQIYKQIENGGGMMPAFKTTLKNEEVANLAQWLAAKK